MKTISVLYSLGTDQLLNIAIFNNLHLVDKKENCRKVRRSTAPTNDRKTASAHQVDSLWTGRLEHANMHKANGVRRDEAA